ncbi:RNA-binding S4 domain-containing protein [Clostridiisalibacter paucivorans]|uniref:RNA-binding S4 domain-containing protein n=1 Tax=Clostridiisalibacter paucivorans TaxID=408753 RepID=UPI00047ADFDB|nr:RNA-binding S4 domain-containing protein [Clostridiisalibacter paucivorans]
MRVDKFLKNARIIKRRTIAKEACEQGRVLVNGKESKPGVEVDIGDIVQINFGNNKMKIEIIDISEHVPKDKAQDMYKILNS